MQITTLPVFSKLADEADVRAAFGDRELPVSLSEHQLRTFEALIDSNIDVVINTAMTGDGKSLAAYLPALLDSERGTFGMYPTNELARDQRKQFISYKAIFGSTMRDGDLWGAKLGRLVEQNPAFERRAEALKQFLFQHQVVLTNPDIFHLMMNYRYESRVLSSQELPYTLSTGYSTFIFDEFHLFSTPQIVSALTAMLFFNATAQHNDNYRPRFLFSSATPRTIFTDMLADSGLRVQNINGDYRSEDTEGYRQVLHRTRLHLYKLVELQSAEKWLNEHIDIIVEHYNLVSNARGVIIVNSVVEARRIARLLRQRLPHLIIGENTGLTDDERRKQAMQAQLIVGTSTIDVGMDFNISLLIFESPDAGTFLQRFGRLGRVRRNGETFAYYEAHALFSSKAPWIYDTFVKELADRGIHDGASVDRPATLRDAVVAAFPQATSFERYVRRWGALQAAHVIASLEDKSREGSHAETAKVLRAQYERVLGLKNINSAIKRYWFMIKHKDETGSTACQAIMDEVLAFRGTSPFQVGVWDDTVTPAAFLSYDAFVIAQSSDICLADWEAVDEALHERFSDTEEYRTTIDSFKYGLKRQEHPLVLYVDAFREERERLVLQMEGFNPKLQLDQVLLLKGFSIKQPRSEETKLLNQVLRRQSVVAYVTRREPVELRRKLHLPAFFPLYQVQDSHEQLYTLALGQAALLVEAESFGRPGKRDDEEEAPIFC
jgi:CRISPR-associated endonuclease/helicase Cas3